MEGWVDLGDFIMPWPGVEPMTAWWKVRPSLTAVPLRSSNSQQCSVGIDLKELAGQLPKCLKFCRGIEIYGRLSLKNERLKTWTGGFNISPTTPLPPTIPALHQWQTKLRLASIMTGCCLLMFWLLVVVSLQNLTSYRIEENNDTARRKMMADRQHSCLVSLSQFHREIYCLMFCGVWVTLYASAHVSFSPTVIKSRLCHVPVVVPIVESLHCVC